MLFDLFSLRTTVLNNRVVMSPLTRSRAVDNNTPNSLMATYYAQRATAGLIITEGTSPSPNGTPSVPAKLKADLRAVFSGPFRLAGGFDGASAEQALIERHADLIAMGRAFLANPDLVERMRQNAPLNAPDPGTFYTPGAKGYTDYPTLAG